MADYPTTIYTPREKENKSGVVYDPTKKTVLYAEDIQKLDDEVVAIETSLIKTREEYVLSALSTSGAANVEDVWCDDTHVFIAGGSPYKIRKYLKSDLSFVAESPSYGGVIYAITGDDTYIYAGGATTNKVRKYLKSDLSFVAESASYGGTIYAIVKNDTHLFIAGATTYTVRKILISDMSTVADSASLTGTVYSLAINATHVFAGASNLNKIRKILISDMSTVADSGSTTGCAKVIVLDDTYLYAFCTTLETIRKYLISNMSFVASNALTGDSDGLAISGDHLYYSTGAFDGILKIKKSDFSFVSFVGPINSTVDSIFPDGDDVFVGTSESDAVAKFSKIILRHSA